MDPAIIRNIILDPVADLSCASLFVKPGTPKISQNAHSVTRLVLGELSWKVFAAPMWENEEIWKWG